MTPLDTLTAADFQPHVGGAYHLTADDGTTFDTILTDVLEHDSPGAPRPPFTLVFLAPLETTTPQGTYRVERAGTETLELFIVPTGPDPDAADGTRYEAVFG